MYTFNFPAVFPYFPALLRGLGVTLEITMLVLALGTVLGMVLSFLRFSPSIIIRSSVALAVNLFIGLPVLVILFWLYYALPIFTPWTISAYTATILTLSLNLACFASDIFVSSYNGIPKSEIEAGIICNFSRWQIFREIIVPQIAKTVIGPISGRYVETIKLTSLASVISVNELLHAGQNLMSLTYRPIEIYTIIAVLYMLLIIPLIVGLKHIENRFTL